MVETTARECALALYTKVREWGREMGYSDKQIEEFSNKYRQIINEFDSLMLNTVASGQQQESAKVREYLLHGVSRRLSVIKKSIENIFNGFPLDAKRPLRRGDLYDVQINMHAYVINLYGIFDNWAWAFVYRHGLLENLGGKHRVGMFKKGMLTHFPNEISEYLKERELGKWHEDYLKSFRDALAHRIPLYIPPSMLTPEEGDRYQELDAQKMGLINVMDWERLNQVEHEQESLGNPCFYFLHSFEGEKPKPILMHPQLLSDGLAIAEFGDLFMKHWESVA